MLNENLFELINATKVHCEIMAHLQTECFPYSPWKKQTFQGFYEEIGTQLIGWLALYQNNPIGFILARQVIDTAEILSFGVLSSFRKKGIGKKLLDQLILNMKIPIFLEVSIENKEAIHLYQSRGFEILTVRKNYYNHPESQGSKDAYLMRQIP